MTSIVEAMPFLRALMPAHASHVTQAMSHIKVCNSQALQDLFVLAVLGPMENGYFVDFGALDGVEINNSLIFEQFLRWQGICVEPALCCHEALKAHRKCHIDHRCVWRESGHMMPFTQTEDVSISTIEEYTYKHSRYKERETVAARYSVETVSLLDLLRTYDAPRVIDYLSIDTEGSEYDILGAFDFDAYTFKTITCEHNYTALREDIYQLLTKNGYTRFYTEFSKHDDWYVHHSAMA